MRKARVVELSKAQRAGLTNVVRARRTEVRLAERCRVVLLAEQGLSDTAIGHQLAISRQKAARWRGRSAELGQAGLERDRVGRGRKKKVSAAQVAEVIRLGPTRFTSPSTWNIARSKCSPSGMVEHSPDALLRRPK